MSFQSRLKEARIAKEYTQEQLANLIGVAKSTYTGYEKGNREPNMLTVSKIIDALGIDANYLWQDEMNASDNSFALECAEIEMIKKFRALNDAGKELVFSTLEKTYDMQYPPHLPGQQTIYEVVSPDVFKEFEKEIQLHDSNFTKRFKLYFGDVPVSSNEYDFELNAAHERTDTCVSDADVKHDEDIMNDDNF